MSTNLSKNRKCKGCGLPLSTDPKNLAYTPNIALSYCQRCFRLKHYGINEKDHLSKISVNEVLNNLKISQRDWIFLINDLLNIDFDVIRKYKDHEKIYFIFNKADIVVNDFNYQTIQVRLQKLLIGLGIKQPNIIISSTFNKLGIRKTFELIKKINWKEKIYFLGKSNSGKSSIINALIRYSGSVIKPLTISGYLNTTIDVKQIKLQKHNLIDTPGYHSEHSILSNLTDLKNIKIIKSKQRIKPISFQIKEPQSFILSNLFWMNVQPHNKASVVFYLPNSMKIQRAKQANLKRNLANIQNQKYQVANTERSNYEFNLNADNKYNVMIEGLGLILVMGVNHLVINTFSNVSVTLLEEWII